MLLRHLVAILVHYTMVTARRLSDRLDDGNSSIILLHWWRRNAEKTKTFPMKRSKVHDFSRSLCVVYMLVEREFKVREFVRETTWSHFDFKNKWAGLLRKFIIEQSEKIFHSIKNCDPLLTICGWGINAQRKGTAVGYVIELWSATRFWILWHKNPDNKWRRLHNRCRLKAAANRIPLKI